MTKLQIETNLEDADQYPAVFIHYKDYKVSIRYFDTDYQKHLQAGDFRPGYFSYLLQCPNEHPVFTIFAGVNMGGDEFRLYLKTQEQSLENEEEVNEAIDELKDAQVLYQASVHAFDRYFPNVLVQEPEEIPEHDDEFDEWFKQKWMSKS